MTGTQRALALAVIGLAVGVFWYVRAPHDRVPVPTRPIPPIEEPKEPEVVQPELVPERPTTVEPARAVASAPAPRAEWDEPALMNQLRQLGDSAPLFTLQLAREGNARFPDSPDAAERGWYVCKSLVNLENFYEAREEARIMVAKYPGTHWAEDVERHLLVNPLDLPGDPPP